MVYELFPDVLKSSPVTDGITKGRIFAEHLNRATGKAGKGKRDENGNGK